MKQAAIIKAIPVAIIFCVFLLPLSATADLDNPLTGTFYGTAYITSPAELGTLDLAFFLDISGTAIVADTSYIDLGKTLMFPAVAPQIKGEDVGPRVSGTLSLTAFDLQTPETFISQIGEKNVNRHIALTGETVENAGNSLSGTYTETISGMGQEDIVITGTFLLVKPTVAVPSEILDANGDGCLDMDEIKAGGNDANEIEYSDVSAAMHLYNSPALSPNICSEEVMQDVLSSYYGTLNE